MGQGLDKGSGLGLELGPGFRISSQVRPYLCLTLGLSLELTLAQIGSKFCVQIVTLTLILGICPNPNLFRSQKWQHRPVFGIIKGVRGRPGGSGETLPLILILILKEKYSRFGTSSLESPQKGPPPPNLTPGILSFRLKSRAGVYLGRVSPSFFMGFWGQNTLRKLRKF